MEIVDKITEYLEEQETLKEVTRDQPYTDEEKRRLVGQKIAKWRQKIAEVRQAKKEPWYFAGSWQEYVRKLEKKIADEKEWWGRRGHDYGEEKVQSSGERRVRERIKFDQPKEKKDLGKRGEYGINYKPL